MRQPDRARPAPYNGHDHDPLQPLRRRALAGQGAAGAPAPEARSGFCERCLLAYCEARLTLPDDAPDAKIMALARQLRRISPRGT